MNPATVATENVYHATAAKEKVNSASAAHEKVNQPVKKMCILKPVVREHVKKANSTKLTQKKSSDMHTSLA